MSWLEKLIQPIRRHRKAKGQHSVPEGVWQQCRKCSAAIFKDTFAKNLGVCVKCGHHHHLTPAQRAAMIFDQDVEPREIGAKLRTKDFLKFTDTRSYTERLTQLTAEDPSREALRSYVGQLAGRPLVLASFDFTFMGGSMGSVAGERFARGIETSSDLGAPFVVFTASGGARMQEGLTALMQMAKTVSGREQLARRRLPFISVLCDPTLGGVAASFAMLADIVIAEPGATIGFTGPRVISDTVGDILPTGFQSSEYQLEHGGVDLIVPRHQLRAEIGKLIGLLSVRAAPR